MSDDTTKLLNACVDYRAMVDKLECENAALKQRILDDNKAYGCELRDQAGTIWDHAKRLQKENAELRAAAVEVCALARVWVTVWGDKISAESIKRLGELEKQVLKEAQP